MPKTEIPVMSYRWGRPVSCQCSLKISLKKLIRNNQGLESTSEVTVAGGNGGKKCRVMIVLGPLHTLCRTRTCLNQHSSAAIMVVHCIHRGICSYRDSTCPCALRGFDAEGQGHEAGNTSASPTVEKWAQQMHRAVQLPRLATVRKPFRRTVQIPVTNRKSFVRTFTRQPMR
jgi:hypothetical protein